jgi:5-methylcytosine-specific restriction endonuclease McrA
MRVDYYKKLRKNKVEIPKSAFEKNYFIAYTFKEAYKICKDKNILLRRLKDLAEIKIEGNTQSYSKRREKKHWSRRKCFVCKSSRSDYQHHIVLLKNGGYDNGINRIPICSDCHKLIHPRLE